MGGKDWQQTILDVATHKYTKLALLLIPLLLALAFRLYPTTLPITDDWAEQTVQNQVVSQYEQQLRQQFPTLPSNQLRSRALEEYQNYRANNAEQIEQQTAQISQQYKQRLQLTLEKGDGTYEQTYFLAIDPYHYLRRAENILEDGDVCDEIQDGECRDTYKLAPEGTRTASTGHDYLMAGMGTVASWFGYAPMSGMFFLPALIAALAVIPAFFIAKRRYGSLAGFTAATIVGLHASLLGRTPAGFTDTDAYAVLFPLILFLTVIYAVEQKGWKRWTAAAGAGAITGIYSWFWTGGWYFAFIILLLSLLAIAVFKLIRAALNKNDYGPGLRSLADTGIYFGTAAVFTTLISGWRSFLNGLLAPVNVSVGIQNPINQNLWPNVLTTVAELNTVGLGSIIGSMGGKFLFVIAILGALTYSFKAKKMNGQDWAIFGGLAVYYSLLMTSNALAFSTFAWLALFALPLAGLLLYDLWTGEHGPIHYGIIIIAWLVASIFATTQGTRFSLLILPVFAIGIGLFIGWLLRALPPLLDEQLEVPRFFGRVAVIVLTALLLFSPVGANYIEQAHQIGKNEVPSMNDAWWQALNTIEQDSQPDAIITSWWDFGHWFKYVADRPVTFDGGSQNTPNAHWVGKLLQTDDYEHSIDILRMLNCGQNNAYDIIAEQEQDTLRAYQLTDNLIREDEAGARELLQERGYEEQTINDILENTHCQPPESYVIVSEDMVGKAGVWAHFGLWDFQKAYAYWAYQNQEQQEAISSIAQRLNQTSGQAAQTYNQIQQLGSRQQANQWISPYPGYGGQRSCSRTNTTISCRLGLQVGQQQGVQFVADTLTIPTDNVENSSINIVAQGRTVRQLTPSTLIVDGEQYDLGGEFSLGIRINENQALLAQPQLLDSTFTQLFYDEEPGPYMNRTTKTNQVTGGKILVYKVDWDAYLADGN